MEKTSCKDDCQPNSPSRREEARITLAPSCGKDNPEGFAFCGFCTAPLETQLPAGEERKTVSVLFCDLVGFTTASETADPEEVRARHALWRLETMAMTSDVDLGSTHKEHCPRIERVRISTSVRAVT